MNPTIVFLEILGFPDVVASGVLAAVITLFGVGIQNYFNFRLQRKQLAHDGEQRNLERAMNMRRDIYLSGAEALGKMQRHLLSFGDPKQTPETQDKISDGVIEALNKVAVIANFEIIEALSNIQNLYSQSLTVMLEKRMELKNALEYKANIDTYIEDLRQRGSQQIAVINSLKNSRDERQRNEIITQFEEIDREFKHYQTELEKIKLQTLYQQAELIRLGFEFSNKFEVLAGRANVLVRRELNFSIDENKYLDLVQKSSAENGSHITGWYENLIEKHKDNL